MISAAEEGYEGLAPIGHNWNPDQFQVQVWKSSDDNPDVLTGMARIFMRVLLRGCQSHEQLSCTTCAIGRQKLALMASHGEMHVPRNLYVPRNLLVLRLPRKIFLCFNDLVLCRRYLAAIPALKTCFRVSLRHHAIIAAPPGRLPQGNNGPG